MKKVPNLRFKEFSGKWEKIKLGDKCTFYSGGTPLTTNKKYYDGNIPFIRSAEISSTSTELNISEDGLNNSSAKMVKKGDLLYALYGATSGEVSISKIDGAINQAILCIQSDRLNLLFLEKILRKNKDNIINTYLQGGQGNLSSKIVQDLRYYFPSLEEQEKIAAFFSLIDKKIALQTEKVEELKNYKKGFMQKIFSRELRFKDENGNEYPEWEEKKLGNFIVEYKEKTTVENEYPVLTSSRSGLMFQTDYFKDRQVTTQDNIGYHIIPRGYITFRSRSDDMTFKFNQNNLIDKGIISYFYPVFCFNESLNNMYALYFMNNYLGCQIRREIVGTSQLVLSLNKLKELKMPVPCIEEQNKIGKLLDNLENKILQEQNKLNYFNRYKKGLLQQMFI